MRFSVINYDKDIVPIGADASPGRAQWPVYAKRAQKLETAGEIEAVLGLLRDCLEWFPDDSAPAYWLAKLLYRLGHVDDAEAAAGFARDLGLEEAPYLILKARIAKRRKIPEMARLHLVRAVAVSDSGNLKQQFVIAGFALDLEAYAAALTAYGRILKREAGSAKAQVGYLQAAIGIGAYDCVLDRLDRWLAAPGASMDLVEIVMMDELRANGDAKRCRALRKLARQRWPDHPALPLRQRWLNEAHGQAVTLAKAGQIDEALTLMQIAAPPSQRRKQPYWRDFVELLEALPRDGDLQRSLIMRAPKTEITISPEGDCETVVYFFCGLAAGAGISARFVDRFFAAKGWRSVFVRDFQRQFFLRGLSSETPSVEVAVDRLLALPVTKSAKRIIVVSNSAGNFGAMRFGLRVGAERVICFSAVGSINEKHRDTINDLRQTTLIKRIAQAVPEPDLDVRSFIEAGGGEVPIDLIYGSEMPEDCSQAAFLDGAPGVNMRVLKGFARHEALSETISRGQMDRVLDGDFSGLS